PCLFAVNFKISNKADAQYNWPVVKAILNVMVIAALTFTVCFVCIILIYEGLHTSSLKIRFRQLQIQLFRALLVQFSVPLVFVCIPFGISFIIPAIGGDLGGLVNLFVLLFDFYPALDPFLVIIAIPR
ncbi:hypothetical protein PFISCL1PPCAC_14396, partial [Pristionchus fissidentatus]